MFVDLGVGDLFEPFSERHWGQERIRLELAMRILRYQNEGIASGDRVFLLYGNKLEFFVDLLSIWLLGGCVVPLDPRLTGFEVENLARATNPSFCLVDSETESVLHDVVEACGARILHTESSELKGPSAVDDLPCLKGFALDSDALILFTSGSTGSPKGVVHTHRSLRARWISLGQTLGQASYRRTLCLLPTHFGHGLICNCLFPWLSGQDLFVAPPFRSDLLTDLGQLIDDKRITFLSSVPSIWRIALKLASPPSGKSIRRVHCGSAPLSVSLWKEIQRWASTEEVLNSYGITETGSWVAGTSMSQFTPEDGLIGEPWGAIIRLSKTADPNHFMSSDALCKTEEQGYVWINTPALMTGYLDRPDLTQRVVHNGWFQSGDIGVLDGAGRLYLRGRERDEINKGGMKIYPADIEAIVEGFDQARDVCVFGFDDPLYGQDVGMAAVLDDASLATLRALHGLLTSRLAAHKYPRRWYLLDEIPRTSRGKVNRDDVRDSCESRNPVDLRRLLEGS